MGRGRGKKRVGHAARTRVDGERKRGQAKGMKGTRGQRVKGHAPMILESALWLPSIWPGMWPPRMKEERKRMKALGGRGAHLGSRLSFSL